MLIIKNLYKKYGKDVVINNLESSFSESGVSLIVGTNGSGKTTLLNILTNMVQADSGLVLLDGMQPSTRSYKSRIFYVPSDFYLPEYMTGKEFSEFILSRYSNGCIEKFNMISKLLGIHSSQEKTLETYSFGMKKKIQIAISIAANTDYIILDEIFNGLDFETSILVQEIFEEISVNRKIIIVSHDRNTLEKFPNDIRLMNKGKLESFRGDPRELYELIKQEGMLNEKLHKIREYL